MKSIQVVAAEEAFDNGKEVVRCSPVGIDRLIAWAESSSRTVVVRRPTDRPTPRQAEAIVELLESIRNGDLRLVDEIDADALSARRRLAKLRESLGASGREIAAAFVAASRADDTDLLVLAFPRYPSGTVELRREDLR